MRLTEEHKQFVVECYAKFMKRADIVEEFVEKFSDDIEQICLEYHKPRDEHIQNQLKSSLKWRFSEDERIEEFNEQYDEYIEPIIRHTKRKLSTQFRRLHIEHPQFPKKYSELFHKTREEHLKKDAEISSDGIQDSLAELEDLYNYVKRMIYVENQISQLPLAHNLLRTIITCQLMDDKQEIIDITPTETKKIESNSNKESNLALPEIPKNDPNHSNQN